MKKIYWIGAGGIFVLAVAAAVLLNKGSNPKELQPAPDFSVQIIGGKRVSLQNFRGKPLVVNFWASWCPSCREEMPALANVASRYGNRVRFLGIIFQDTEANAIAFEKQAKIPYKSALDPGGKAAAVYKISGVPETFVIDSKGRLRYSWIGAIDEKRLTDFVESVLE